MWINCQWRTRLETKYHLFDGFASSDAAQRFFSRTATFQNQYSITLQRDLNDAINNKDERIATQPMMP